MAQHLWSKGTTMMTSEDGAPNLDCQSSDDLMAFWLRHQRGRKVRELFPAGGKGTRRATADLANYASNKATAQDCRLRGDIKAALIYEGICDRIYDRLPEFARW
jgi:hypothetical protein